MVKNEANEWLEILKRELVELEKRLKQDARELEIMREQIKQLVSKTPTL